MIGSLRQTGSDFVVVCYRRFNEQRRWAPGHWIVDAHAVDRPAVTLREFPDILVNAVVWSKIFRCSFWDEAAMRFPEALDEDQPVSARAYARARTFDVLSDVLYDWRVRTDGSSISQQTKDLADLRQRLRAADDSLEELRSAGLEDVAVERLIQVLSNDLQHSTKHIPEMSADHWSTLVEGVRRLMDHLPQERWAEVPPQHAVLEWLIHEDLRAEAVEFVESDGRDLDRWPTELRDDAFVVRVPFWDHPAVPPAAADGTETLRLRTAVRRAVWESPARLRLEGWAYIAGIDLADHPTTVQLWLQDSTGHVVPLEVVAAQDPEIDRISKHRWNDYRPSVFHAWVDSEQLRADDTPNDYEPWVTVRTGKVERRRPGDRCTHARFGRRGAYPYVPLRHPRPAHRLGGRTCVVRARALPHMVENVSVVDRCRARARARPVRYRHPVDVAAGRGLLGHGRGEGERERRGLRHQPGPLPADAQGRGVRRLDRATAPGIRCQGRTRLARLGRPAAGVGRRPAAGANRGGQLRGVAVDVDAHRRRGGLRRRRAGARGHGPSGRRRRADPARRPPRRGQRTGTRRRGT